MRNNLVLKRLDHTNLHQISDLQTEVFTKDPNCKEWLRFNSVKTFKEILENTNQYVIGHFDREKLVSVGILYDAQTTDENIKKYLTDDETQMLNSINLKVVFSSVEYRRCGLAREIVQELRKTAEELGKETICCTIHPMNSSSKTLFQSFGYQQFSKTETSYGIREVWELNLIHNQYIIDKFIGE